MATSGSVDFSVSRDNLIEDSMRLVGAIGPEDSASASQKTHAARLLNMLVKSWGSFGPALWARKTGWILPQTDTNDIDLGPSGDHATLSYVQTLTSAAALSGATTITVDSITGISNLYPIGIETEDGMHWTTVNGAPAGSTVTITTALTADVAADAYVYVYATKLQRPVRILEAYIRNEDSDVEWSIDVVAKSEYERMGAKASTGIPNLLSYDPQLDQGVARIFPQMTDGTHLIKIVFQRPFEDFDAASDTPDFPQEWYLPLCYNLGVLLAPVYGLPVSDRASLAKEADALLRLVQSNEPEEGSFRIVPDIR